MNISMQLASNQLLVGSTQQKTSTYHWVTVCTRKRSSRLVRPKLFCWRIRQREFNCLKWFFESLYWNVWPSILVSAHLPTDQSGNLHFMLSSWFNSVLCGTVDGERERSLIFAWLLITFIRQFNNLIGSTIRQHRLSKVAPAVRRSKLPSFAGLTNCLTSCKLQLVTALC